MKLCGKWLIGLLCVCALALSCSCKRSTLVPVKPYHEQPQPQTQPQTPTPSVEQPPTEEEPQEQEDNEEAEEPEQDLPQPQESVTVRFVFHDGSSITKSFEKGETVDESDVPAFEEQTGYTYVWNFDGAPLAQNVDYTQTRYKDISTAQEFLSIEPTQTYILKADITLLHSQSIPTFEGVIEGNGKRIVIETQNQTLFDTFCGTLQNITVQAKFVGKQAPSGSYTAQGCALFNEITGNARFVNCRFFVEYTVGATEQSPSAGLAQSLTNAYFEDCILQTQTNLNAHIYAVCVTKSLSLTFAGLAVQGDCQKEYKFCE